MSTEKGAEAYPGYPQQAPPAAYGAPAYGQPAYPPQQQPYGSPYPQAQPPVIIQQAPQHHKDSKTDDLCFGW
ncbi:hypothetical protein BGZ93_004316 [Podila epicladia]|nr:hypothetical protein BGZ93_004316 [Podila epicladia]